MSIKAGFLDFVLMFQLWEVPIQKVAAKFREHNLNRAADILDDYILHSYST